jgi:uncharacterized membrane protein YbhN (UPF0104 family)
MKRIRWVIQAALIALCLLPVGRQVIHDSGAIGVVASQLKVPALLASCLLLIVASLFLPTAMAAFTHGGAHRIGFRHSALAYYSSQPMKYLPGSFWILPGRVMLLQGLGHGAGLSAAGLLFEMTTQVLSGSLVAAVLLGLTGFASGGYANAVWLILAGSLAVSLLLLVSPALAQRMLPHASPIRPAIAQLAEIPPAARLRNLAVTVLSFTTMWVVMGASFYLLLVATAPHVAGTLLKVAVGISTVSWLVGFLAPFSPGGIGVREGAIVLLLSAVVPGPQAAFVALLSRLLALAVELAFAGGAWLVMRRARASAGPRATRVPWPLILGWRLAPSVAPRLSSSPRQSADLVPPRNPEIPRGHPQAIERENRRL